jgi:membrane protein insertase Oxa1/YidC/SpoIIIJ
MTNFIHSTVYKLKVQQVAGCMPVLLCFPHAGLMPVLGKIVDYKEVSLIFYQIFSVISKTVFFSGDSPPRISPLYRHYLF